MALKDFTPQEEFLEKDLVAGVIQWLQRGLGYGDAEIGEVFQYFSQGIYKGPIPKEPFVIYFFSLTDMPVKLDERRQMSSGYGQTGLRYGTLSFTGFGAGAHELLTRLSFATDPDLIPDNMTIENLSPILDISEFDDTTIEPRYSKDFAITYRLTTTEPTTPATWAERIRVNGEDVII